MNTTTKGHPVTLTVRGRVAATVAVGLLGGAVAAASLWSGWRLDDFNTAGYLCLIGFAASGCALLTARIVAQYGSLR